MTNDTVGSVHDCDNRVCDRNGGRVSEDRPGINDKKNLKKIIIGLGAGYGFAAWFFINQDLNTRNRYAPVLMDPNDLVAFIYLVTIGMAVLFIIVFELQSKK